MTITEMWIPIVDEDATTIKDYLPATIVSVGKKNMYSQEGRPMDEYLSALVFLEDGKLVEVPMEQCFIKKIHDEKSKTEEPISFSKPRRADK